MPQFADFEQAGAWLSRHPQVRFVDLLLADQMGIPRGKRVTVAELEGVHGNGPAAARLDVRARRARRHDPVHRPRLRRGRRRPRLPADPGHARARALARRPKSRRCRSACTSTTARRSTAIRATCSSRWSRRFAALGLRPVMAVELEFYLVDRERTAAGPRAAAAAAADRAGANTRPRSTRCRSSTSTPRSSHAIDAAARAQELPTGTVLAEYGPGQFEVNLHHVDDALLACDHAIRLKRLVKGVALQHGMEATFMPKPYRDHAGSGAHLHISLVDAHGPQHLRRRRPSRQRPAAPRDRRPRRDHERRDGHLRADRKLVPPLPARSVRAAQSELVGQQPRRRVPRAARARRTSRRVEHRVAGADANPYLLAAIVLAGMHLGLTRQLDPGPVLAGNAYRDTTPTIPLSWSRRSRRVRAQRLRAGVPGRALRAPVRADTARRDAGLQLLRTGHRL